jgi:DsbC/DsbD-like thiol-disulfide interchange protein
MNNTILRIVFVWLLWLSSNQITAASADSGLIRLELLADVKGISPGKAFHLGVLMKIKPQWHVYWINAGDAAGGEYIGSV